MNAKPDLTRNEALVLDALRRGAAPASAYQLLEILRGEGLRAPPQVYRALKSLGERGLVHRLDSRNAFLACSHDHAHEGEGHAVVFLVCRSCEAVEEVCGDAFDAVVLSIAKAHGFRKEGSSVEIEGICRRCAASHAAHERPNA